jgi:hypothetical protein
MGHSDAIESVTFRHAEGNERKKNGVKRGIAAFYGCKLLKRQVEHLSLQPHHAFERPLFSIELSESTSR